MSNRCRTGGAVGRPSYCSKLAPPDTATEASVLDDDWVTGASNAKDEDKDVGNSVVTAAVGAARVEGNSSNSDRSIVLSQTCGKGACVSSGQAAAADADPPAAADATAGATSVDTECGHPQEPPAANKCCDPWVAE